MSGFVLDGRQRRFQDMLNELLQPHHEPPAVELLLFLNARERITAFRVLDRHSSTGSGPLSSDLNVSVDVAGSMGATRPGSSSMGATDWSHRRSAAGASLGELHQHQHQQSSKNETALGNRESITAISPSPVSGDDSLQHLQDTAGAHLLLPEAVSAQDFTILKVLGQVRQVYYLHAGKLISP